MDGEERSIYKVHEDTMAAATNMTISIVYAIFFLI